MKDNVLLIGNGINNLDSSNSYRWKDLVNDLIKNFAVGRKIKSVGKPFPLLYEELFANAVGNGKFKETEIKAFIAERTFQIINPNKMHEAFINLQYKNILTTNYDYNLEFNLQSNFNSYTNIGFKKEKLYSLYRHHVINETNFWHIHGEARLPQTINLGYEQYGGYLQFLRNYLINGISDNNGKRILYPFINRLHASHAVNYSWVDFFFTKDIYIIGLTLDMDEMHLWWLLSFRQRYRLIKDKSIINTITYFYPKACTNNAKLDLLNSLNVKTVCINAEGEKFYHEILKKLNS